MIRVLLFLLIAASVTARASDPISAPVQGASAIVTQPHVTAELIPETTTVQPGQPFDVALHLHADPDWHTYWINPGDAGLATTISWTLPAGFSAGPIQWPTPEKHAMGPLMTYGYAGDVYLLVTITSPKADLPRHFDLKADAQWLVCKEECIPGHADLTLPLDSGLLNLRLPTENKDFFDRARERLPVPNKFWDVFAALGSPSGASDSKTKNALWIEFIAKVQNESAYPELDNHFYFFPEQGNILSPQETIYFGTAMAIKSDSKTGAFRCVIPLQQNGDKFSQLSGVLVFDPPLAGNVKAVSIPAFKPGDAGVLKVHNEEFQLPSVSSVAAAVPSGGPASPSGGPGYLLPGSPQATGGDQAHVAAPPLGTAAATPRPFFLGILGAAFLGGLILNLMPCVLPVLSLKVFSLVRHAGNDPRGAWKQGGAFTAGVVVSFWILAGLLLALRAFGNDLGWGFQMQSPGFVLALIFLFFLLALNLLGVFEIGTSLAGVDAKATSRFSGSASSFANGALATVAATPCTGPYLGWALGLAVQESTFASLLIFTFIAFGLAAPYLLLTTFPGALRFVPKPGAWMEALRQFMGFLLLATVIWLVYIFGALVGEERVPFLLGSLLLATVAAWIYGRWVSRDKPLRHRIVSTILALVFMAAALKAGLFLALTAPAGTVARSAMATSGEIWQPWTPAAVDQALEQGQPVFVDFTAAWCGNCKVNEWYALENKDVLKAFADKKVALFRADWTRYDPDITKTLLKYNRSGVPLYLLYSPKEKDSPQVLPDGLITPGIVLDALKKL